MGFWLVVVVLCILVESPLPLFMMLILYLMARTIQSHLFLPDGKPRKFKYGHWDWYLNDRKWEKNQLRLHEQMRQDEVDNSRLLLFSDHCRSCQRLVNSGVHQDRNGKWRDERGRFVQSPSHYYYESAESNQPGLVVVAGRDEWERIFRTSEPSLPHIHDTWGKVYDKCQCPGCVREREYVTTHQRPEKPAPVFGECSDCNTNSLYDQRSPTPRCYTCTEYQIVKNHNLNTWGMTYEQWAQRQAERERMEA